MAPVSVLIVDDDEEFRSSLALLLNREGHSIREAGSLEDAKRLLAESTPDVVLVDLGLPDGDGASLLKDEAVAAQSELVVITGNASVPSAIEALRHGATDYLVKPVERSRLRAIFANVTRTRELKTEIRGLKHELRDLGRFGRLVGHSPAMQRVFDLIDRVTRTNASVLITGESGTGKEVVAETIHRMGSRKAARFLAVNCGAIAPSLMESELFGHQKGSFTSADRERRGHFEEANGGTLFLDEVTEMPIELQVKLLRVLETGTITRVGSSEVIPVDVRVIAATNQDPLEAIKARALREDLYYRLNVFPIQLPPLRDRGEDLVMLANQFLAEATERHGVECRWSSEATERLTNYAWPGNVRELRNAVERAVILSDGVIRPESLPASAPIDRHATHGPTLEVRVGASIEEVERRLIFATLDQLKGDKRRAAKILGVSLKTLYNRLNAYELADPRGHGESAAAGNGTSGQLAAESA
ncbi:MAG: sigma-54-dependent Fis family transcriptional regulator [Candidatus Eisenbacteria bacterium]|uniref:Sigma-54-dependent Fis family transcriptional regulator n=1 Tax=Eiseniibacteriota bacterium TaxID=2212470 RepID=A0A849SP39_UNCEI|nr:sigma-54-dependent Fis family transcriptional regulator [Candidatus Eisenbacteria bacterium]